MTHGNLVRSCVMPVLSSVIATIEAISRTLPEGRSRRVWLDLEEQHNERVSVADQVVQRTSI